MTKDLLAEYGQLMIQLEMLNIKINECKQKLALEMAQQKKEEEAK
jgi:hypothetical protein